jgi:hypothetical protein
VTPTSAQATRTPQSKANWRHAQLSGLSTSPSATRKNGDAYNADHNQGYFLRRHRYFLTAGWVSEWPRSEQGRNSRRGHGRTVGRAYSPTRATSQIRDSGAWSQFCRDNAFICDHNQGVFHWLRRNAPWQNRRSIPPLSIVTKPPLIITQPRIIIIRPLIITNLARKMRRRGMPKLLTNTAKRGTNIRQPHTNILTNDVT